MQKKGSVNSSNCRDVENILKTLPIPSILRCWAAGANIAALGEGVFFGAFFV